MHAWWMRVFSSAYGSCAGDADGISCWLWPVRSSAVAEELPLEVLRRSWRPMSYDLASAGRRRRFLLVSLTAGKSSFAIALIDFDTSADSSASTTGLPRLTESGTARSDGNSNRTFIPSAPSTSCGFMPTLELERLRPMRTRCFGNDGR